MQVLILGYGEMGHAMEALLHARHRVAIWDKYPPDGMVPVRLEEAVPAADVIVFCLPATPHREVLEGIIPVLPRQSLCVTVAKGLDEAGHTALDVFSDCLEQRGEFALVYGPMIAEELCSGRYGFGLAACTASAYQRARSLFAGSRLLLSHTTDMRGASWSVILKNVYAIGFGIVDGLEMGDNVRGFLMVRALAELCRIVEDMGGDARTCRELPGLGDLTTTATSADSHHHALGERLARGVAEGIAGEGVHTLHMVEKHGLLEIQHYPLFQAIRDIVHEPGAARARMDDYLTACFAGPG